MNHLEERDETFSVLRELPVEVTVEQVGAMVTAFTLALPTASSWFANTLSRLSKINLNSILMTTAGTILIAGSVYLFNAGGATGTAQRNNEPSPITEEVMTPPDMEPAIVLPPIPEDKPIVPVEAKEEKAEGPKTLATPTPPLPPTKAIAPIPAVAPVPPVPPVRSIKVVPAIAGVEVLGDCVLAVEGVVSREGTKKEYDIKGFNGITVMGSIDVIVEQGDFAVVAEGDPVMIERLEIELKDKTIQIRMGNARSGTKYGECEDGAYAHVRVRLPALANLELTGSADVRMEDFDTPGELGLVLRGSGDISFASLKGVSTLNVELNGSGDIVGENARVSGRTKIDLAGSGDVRLAGSTDAIEVMLVGSGDVDASELGARACNVQVIGSGDVRVDCSTILDQRITGSGDVHRTGNARRSGSNSEGSGSN